MKAQRVTNPANRKGRRAAPKQAIADAIKAEAAPFYGPVIVGGTDAPGPAHVAEPVKAGLPVVIETYKPDVSIAVEAMAAMSARLNRPRRFFGLDLWGVAALVLAMRALKVAVLAIV